MKLTIRCQLAHALPKEEVAISTFAVVNFRGPGRSWQAERGRGDLVFSFFRKQRILRSRRVGPSHDWSNLPSNRLNKSGVASLLGSFHN